MTLLNPAFIILFPVIFPARPNKRMNNAQHNTLPDVDFYAQVPTYTINVWLGGCIGNIVSSDF